jgi:RimJ/RimL family protein N-acetyltransferase
VLADRDRPLRVATAVPGLELSELLPADAVEYHQLISRNSEHLSADYAEEAAATLDAVRNYFLHPPDRNLRMGIRLHTRLIGRVDLNPVAPPRYAIGYWLDAASCGRGYATAACTALIAHARVRLGATDIYAGVRYGNDRSVALLARLRFTELARLATYTRFHLPLAGERRHPMPSAPS